jgi:hypothetical protein
MSDTITISPRFIGPPDSGNGGYTCGLVAGSLPEGPVEATLRLPPPIDRPLRIEHSHDYAALFDGDQLVADARPADLTVELPERVSLAAARRAADAFDLTEYAVRHHYPGCFTCGPQRDAGDGLRIFPAAIAPGVVAWPWSPDPSLVDTDGLVRPVLLWAALDCPSGMAWFHERPPVTPHVLGRMTAAIHRRPAAGEPLVVCGWVIGTDGRKRSSGSVIWSADGEVLAENLAVWIELTEEQRRAFAAAGDAPG